MKRFSIDDETRLAIITPIVPLDLSTYVVQSVGLALAALLASYLPARRAARLAPAETLRSGT